MRVGQNRPRLLSCTLCPAPLVMSSSPAPAHLPVIVCGIVIVPDCEQWHPAVQLLRQQGQAGVQCSTAQHSIAQHSTRLQKCR